MGSGVGGSPADATAAFYASPRAAESPFGHNSGRCVAWCRGSLSLWSPSGRQRAPHSGSRTDGTRGPVAMGRGRARHDRTRGHREILVRPYHLESQRRPPRLALGPWRGQLRQGRLAGHRGRSRDQLHLDGHQPLHPVHSTNTEKAIVIGGTVYQANPIPGFRFTVLPRAAVPEAAPGAAWVLPGAQRGVALDSLQGPMPWHPCATSVRPRRRRGHHAVRGHVCTLPRLRAAPAACGGDPASEPRLGRRRRRLLQVRSTSYFSGRPPRGAKLPARVR